MPVIQKSTYQRPKRLLHGHLETIVPALFRKVNGNRAVKRIRVDTPDNDFLDLDWHYNEGDKAIILSHGLEGDSTRPYIQGMARQFYRNGWNVIAWNFRGCSGEMNRTEKFYHSGATYDLETVVEYVIGKGISQVAVLGFSLGGNMTLKYLGEGKVPKEVKAGMAISTPIDLVGCSEELAKTKNYLYSKRFLKSLKQKVEDKSQVIPELKRFGPVESIQTIYEFDDKITAPLNGFENALDYYQKCSSVNYVPSIEIPTLLVNAANDSFLSPSCYDSANFESSENVYLEIPKFGGHVGFSNYQHKGTYWSELRAYEYISQIIK